MSEPLTYGIHNGDLKSFVKWWNEQDTYYYNGAMRIVHIDVCHGFEGAEDFVEYVLQDVR